MTVSFLLLMACPSVLCRYLILLDKFLENRSPQEIEALTMPTLEELREAFDAQGAQWVQQALAANTGGCRQVMWILAHYRILHEFFC